jgi:protein TonB
MTPVSEAYLTLISQHIMNRKTYPAEARERSIEGHAVIRFELLREGRVQGCTIITGSGHSIIDRAALELIEGAQPFPPFFARMEQHSLTLQLEVVYDLEEPAR